MNWEELDAVASSLPSWFPESQRRMFPWNQPIVFRSGRYFVHRIDRKPMAEKIDIPDWNELDGLDPND